jgi:hypothetical protein
MWIPQVIFCSVARCWLAQADPLPSEQACMEYVDRTMLPVIVFTVPDIRIRGARCVSMDTPA